MLRSLLATFYSILIGGIIAFAFIVFVLETLHTKHELPNLICVIAGAGLGCLIAISIRRSLLAPKPRSNVSLSNAQEFDEDAE